MSYFDAGGIFLPVYHAAGYDGATETRQRKRYAFNRSKPVDEDRLLGPRDRSRLRLECMDLRRNNAIVAGVCERFADNVVGPEGITPQAKTSSDEWNQEAEAFWGEWSKIVDFRQRINMRELQRLIVQGRLLAGEVFNGFLKNGQLQPIESERCCTPRESTEDESIIDGVRTGRTGIPVGYYFAKRNRQGSIDTGTTEFRRREDICHSYRPIRFDQLRGIPELAPVLNALSDFGRMTEETLNKAVLDAMHAWAIHTAEGAGKISNLNPRIASQTGSDSLQKHETFEGGMNFYLRPGEDVKSLASNTPNSQYVNFSEMLLRIIGAALSIPYEFLLLDFKQGSFSASRAALMQTYRTFTMWQAWLRDCFLQRTWNWRVAKAIKEGTIAPAPMVNGASEWFKVRWIPPSYDWLEPKKEVDANTDEWNLGTESITSIARKKGKDGEDVLREKAADIAVAQKIADETNAEFGTALTWRDLINSTRPGQAPVKTETNQE